MDSRYIRRTSWTTRTRYSWSVGRVANPRKDCEVVLDDHSQERRVDRGLTMMDLIRIVREGSWRARPDGHHDVVHRSWTIRVKQGNCTISVDTIMPKR